MALIFRFAVVVWAAFMGLVFGAFIGMVVGFALDVVLNHPTYSLALGGAYLCAVLGLCLGVAWMGLKLARDG